MSDLVDKIAIIGEEHQPLGVGIEATGWFEGDSREIDKLGDNLLRIGIRDGRNIAHGFVQSNVVPLPWGWQRFTIYENLVLSRINQNAFFDNGFAIYSNATCGNELLSASAGRDSGVGDCFLETDAGCGSF